MDRRNLLQSLVALSGGSCVMTTPARAANPDAELIAVAAELEAVLHELDRWERNEIKLTEDQSDSLCERSNRLATRLTGLEATTPEGVQAKVSATFDVVASGCPDNDLVLSTLNDVLAGGRG